MRICRLLGSVVAASGGGWGCDVRSLRSARGVRSRVRGCRGNRQQAARLPKRPRPPAGPARLKRGLGGSRNVHRRSEEPASPEDQDCQYTSGQKGVLRTAGSKLIFAHFCSATKVGRRRQKSLGMANAKKGPARRRNLPRRASGKVSHRCGTTIPGPCPGPPIVPLLLTVGPNRLTGAARACQPGPFLEISSLTLPPAALR